MFYDCIVVGAGPAGSTTAKILSQCGYKVLIIDSKTFPREKLCGGCISAKITNYIPHINNLTEKKAFKAILSYKKSACLSIESTEPFAYFVDRKIFDAYLLDNAIQNGCKFENERLLSLNSDGNIINLYTNKSHYNTKYLIGADGANSTVRKILHIKPKFKIKTLQGKSNALMDYVNIDIGFHRINYYWSFPQNQVCGVASTKKNINELFNLHYNTTNDIFGVKGYFIPIAFSKNHLGKNNILLVGDAACLADPFSLEGIYNAIYSAHLAAASILASPQNPYKAYVCLAGKILEDNKYSYYISKIVSSFPYAAFARLSRGNESILADYLKGKKSSKDLFWLLIKNLHKKRLNNN